MRLEPEDSGDTNTPSDKIPDQGCGHGLGRLATQGVEFRALWLQSSSGDHTAAARVRAHILSHGRQTMVGWEVMDQEEDAPEQRPRSQRDLSQQKISITDSCLPFIFNYITLIVSLTVGIEDVEVDIHRSEQDILALKRPAA